MNVSFLQDIATVARKDLKENFAGGSGRGRFLLLIALGVFGILVPLISGSHNSSWVSSEIPPILYGFFVPIELILGVGADAFAGERERHTLETLLASRLPDHAILFGKLFAVTLFGWAQSLLAALLAMLVINVVFGGPAIYPLATVVAIVVYGLLVALVVAAVAALVSLRAATVRQAAQMLSIGLIVLVVVIVLGIQALPAATRQSLSASQNSGALSLVIAALLIVVAAILILWAMALFRRAKLMLSES